MSSFSKVFKYLKPYRLMVIFSVVLMISEVASNILQPKYMEEIVDGGVLSMNMDVVCHSGIMMLVVAVVGGIGGFISCVLSNTYSQRFGNDLRKSLFRKIMSLSPEQGDAFTSGSLITRMTGDTRVVTEFSSVVIQMVVKPLMLFVFGIVMVLSIDLFYGVILLVTLPLQLGLMYFFIKRSSVIFKKIQQMTDRLNITALHIVSDNRLIKAYTKENYETSGFDRQNLEITSTVLRVQLFMSILNPLIMFILNAVVLAVIFVGGFQVQAQAMQVGSIMAAISYSQQILMSMMTIGGFFQYISRSKVSAERIAEVMDMEPAVKSGSTKAFDVFEKLEVRNLTFRYPGCKHAEIPALNNLSFGLSRGEKLGILGTTGSGKSTLAALLIRLYDCDGGEIIINGVSISDYELGGLRGKIMLVYQDGSILPGTLRENIVRGVKDCTSESFLKAASTALADEVAESLCDGYDTVVSERGASLSGGQKQRTSIARALVREPQVLILDDSTSSLDAETERRVFENIDKNYPGLTRVIISQRVSAVSGADRILLLDNGNLIASGSHEELMRGCALYRSIYETQNPEGGDELG